MTQLQRSSATRREFLSQTVAGSAVVAIGSSLAPALMCHAAADAADEQRILVVVEMAGGNDGLNCVVPAKDPAYRSSRPKLAINAKDTRSVTDEIGLHPAMRGMSDLLEQGRFAIVQGVGYDKPNRSHFDSMDIWHTCQRKNETRTDGWIGRYLQSIGLSQDPTGLHLGNDKQPFALMSRDVRVPSIQSLEQFRLDGSGRPEFVDAISDLSGQTREEGNDLLGFVQTSTASAIRASRRMESAGAAYKPSRPYPQTPLGKKFQTVAKLIASGLQTKVFYLRIDGFDTHANQPDAHAGLLRQVSDAVATFVDDMVAIGQAERVLTMCFSEFGRRVAENASDGTDHGTAGPILLAGTKIKPGLIGKHPSLTDLADGDLKYHTDFRQVYAAVLQDWLRCPNAHEMIGDYKPIELFG